jgi:hypothetical protein
MLPAFGRTPAFDGRMASLKAMWNDLHPIFARMRSFAHNILRFNQSDTIPQDRFAAALGGLKSLFSMTFSTEH